MGRRLASLRALRGLTQSEAAERAGISQPALSLLERDIKTSPPLNTVIKLATLYETSLDYLANGRAA